MASCKASCTWDFNLVHPVINGLVQGKLYRKPRPHLVDEEPAVCEQRPVGCTCNCRFPLCRSRSKMGNIWNVVKPIVMNCKKKHRHRPQTVGGFKKCFEEQAQTHENALRTPNSTLFGEKCKMRPPATKENKKRDKLGDKRGDKTSGRWTHHPTPRRTC